MISKIHNNKIMHKNHQIILENIRWANLPDLEGGSANFVYDKPIPTFCDCEIKKSNARLLVNETRGSIYTSDTEWVKLVDLGNKILDLVNLYSDDESDNSDNESESIFDIFTNDANDCYIFRYESSTSSDNVCYGMILLSDKILHKIIGMCGSHPFIDSTYFHYANSDGSGPQNFDIKGEVDGNKILQKIDRYYNRFVKDNYH